MSDEHSVTQFISGLLNGDSTAANEIWTRYYSQLLTLAAHKLQNCPRRVLDEDDVVQAAFENFFRLAPENRFPKLNDRDDLWQVLAMLVDRRAKDQFRKITSQKNGYGQVQGDSINKLSDQAPVIDAARAVQPTGDQAVEFAEQVEQRLKQLDDDTHRKVALLKLAGHTNLDIKEKIGKSLRTVERILETIREDWSKQDRSGMNRSQ